MKKIDVIIIVLLFLLFNTLYAADPPLPIIATGQNSDGRLEIFYIQSNTLVHRWQIAPSGGWSDEYNFYEPAMGVAVDRDSEGCLNVFVIQPDYSLIHILQSAPNDGWIDPVKMGETAKSIALIHDHGDTLHLFYSSAENILYHLTQTLPQKDWSGRSVLAEVAGDVAAGRNLDGRLEVFYSGTGDTLFHKWQNAPGGPWSDQTVFAGPVKQIEIGQNQDGRLEAFFIDQSDVLYHKWQVAPSSGWDAPAVFSDDARFVTSGRNSNGRMEVLFTHQEDILQHRCQIAPDSAWHFAEQFGWTAKSVSIAQNADGRLEVFYLDVDDVLFHNWQLRPGKFWAGEYPFLNLEQPLFTVDEFPENPNYAPGAGNWHVNDHCFIQGPDNRWHMYGIVWPDPGSGDATIVNYFGHASADHLSQPTWVEEEPPFHESLAGGKVLWAPHVIQHEGTYYLFYCDGGEVENYAIVARTSPDLVTWSDPVLCFTDGYQGRDPMVLWCAEKGEWIMYYAATEYPAGGNFIVACRTSEDLIHWSDRQIAYKDFHQGTGYGPTESPFVVRRGGTYYLFLGPRPYDHPTNELPNWDHPGYVGTDVFRSGRRDLWTNADYVGHIEAHAPEIVQDEYGDWFVSSAGVLQGGLYLTSLTWLDGLDSDVPDGDLSLCPQFHLMQNYPNPFNSQTTIQFSLPKESDVIIDLFNLRGQKIDTIVKSVFSQGLHQISYHAETLSSGIYYYRLITNSYVSVKKLLYLK